MKKGGLPIQYVNWLQSRVFHLSWVHLLYSTSRVALRLEPEGRRGRSGGRDLRLYLNRLSTISCIVSPVFILISRNAHAANSWAVSEFQDINQVISWLSSCIAEDLAFSLLQSYPSTVNPWTTGLNCARQLTHGFFFNKYLYSFPSESTDAKCQLYALMYAILYRGLEHLWIFISTGRSWNQFPPWILRANLSFGGVKVICRLLTAGGGSWCL